MADLTEIESRLYRIREPGSVWGGSEGFEDDEPITLNELAGYVESVIEAVRELRGELESHASRQHHDPPQW